MTYNLEAMRSTLEWAQNGGDDEAEFDLDNWARRYTDGNGTACGTVLCLAGKAVHDAGYEFKWSSISHYSVPGEPNEMARNAFLPSGRLSTVKEVGALALGLYAAEAQALFVPDLDIEGITKTAERKFALDFLAYLVERAEAGLRHLSGTEVDAWVSTWCDEYELSH